MKKDEVNVSEDKTSTPIFDNDKDGARVPSSDVETGTGYVETVETTKRGLKARHAQMIALGGTIGKLQWKYSKGHL
jgi:amino acid transporter